MDVLSPRLSRSRFVLALAISGLLAGASVHAQSFLHFEDFDSDPQWDGLRNRNVPNPAPTVTQNFGRRVSNNAGGVLGELGGNIVRTTTPAWYADDITTKTFNNLLTASGKISMPTGSTSGGLHFGWFNSQRQGWRPWSAIGFRLDGRGSTHSNILLDYMTQTWRAGGVNLGSPDGSVFRVPHNNSDHTWSMTYDPSGAAGNGALSFTFDGNTSVLALTAGDKAQGANFDRFGLWNQQVSGEGMDIFLDDINYDGSFQDFTNTNTGWEAHGNSATFQDPEQNGAHNYGWSQTTNHAGGQAGELGGISWRTDIDTETYYAADTQQNLTFDQPLFASGKVAMLRGASDGAMYFGWLNKNSIENTVVDPNNAQIAPLANYLGITIEGPSRAGHYFRPVFGAANAIRRDSQDGPVIFPDGESHDFTITYDPSDNNGLGRITVTLDELVKVFDLTQADRDSGAILDHFGIFNISPGGHYVEAFFDDLTFTNDVPDPQWIRNSSGNWHTETNWLGGAPNAVGAVARLHSFINAPRTVFANSNVTVGTIEFDNANMYLLTGLGTLTMQVNSGSALIDVQQGNHKINLPLSIASNTTLDVAAGATLTISDPVTVNAGKNLSQSGGGGTVLYESTVTLLSGAGAAFGSSQHLEGLSVGLGATVDVMESALVVEGAAYSKLEALVKRGFNGGDWLGDGITSSSAADDTSFITAVGVVDNADAGYSSFGGFDGLDGNEILIRHTIYGDADLSGTVNLDDFNQFLFGFNGGAGGPAAIWLNGDFNYNGAVNLDDFNQFLAGLQHQSRRAGMSPELFSTLADFVRDEGLDVDLSTVPEPSALGLIGLGALGLLRRRARSVTAAVVAAGSVPALGAFQVTENFGFDTDSYWVGSGNRSNGQDYGWSDTDKTGTAVIPPGGSATADGEMGGAFFRSVTPAYYGFDVDNDDADRLNGADVLSASGVYHYESGGGGLFFGWFNDTTTQQISDARNFIGVLLDDGFKVYVVGASQGDHDREAAFPGGDPGGTIAPFAPGSTHSWSIDYNPAAASGKGAITVNFDGNSYVNSLTGVNINTALPFNRFGAFHVGAAGGIVNAFWDDITFTSENQPPPVPTGSIWKVNNDGDWMTASNWINGVPNTVGAEATLGSFITSQHLAYADAPVTVGTIHFDNANSYLVAGLGSLTFQVSTGTALVDVQQGTHKINLPVVVASDTDLSVESGATLMISDPITVNAGKSLTQGGDGDVNYESTVTVNAGGNIEFGNSSRFAGLTLASGASADLSADDGGALMIDSVSINSTATLDLSNNDLIVAEGSYSTIEAKVKQGFNAGNWLGSGITSSAAAGDTSFVTAVGIVDNADIGYTEFSGFSNLEGDEILLKHTYYGDADLGGTVNLDDFNQFLFGYNNGAGGPPAIWLNGDFDYNGSINLDDFNQFLFGLQNQGAALVSAQLYAALTTFVQSEGIDVDLSTVPEPSTLGLLLAAAMMPRRRRPGTR